MLGTKIEIACQKASAKHLRSIWHTDPKRIQVESITQGARSSLSSYTYIELSTKSWLLGHSELTAQTRIWWSGSTQSMRREQLRGIKQTSLYCVISDWFFARGREWESEKGKDRRFHVNLDLWPQNEYRKKKDGEAHATCLQATFFENYIFPWGLQFPVFFPDPFSVEFSETDPSPKTLCRKLCCSCLIMNHEYLRKSLRKLTLPHPLMKSCFLP